MEEVAVWIVPEFCGVSYSCDISSYGVSIEISIQRMCVRFVSIVVALVPLMTFQ